MFFRNMSVLGFILSGLLMYASDLLCNFTDAELAARSNAAQGVLIGFYALKKIDEWVERRK